MKTPKKSPSNARRTTRRTAEPNERLATIFPFTHASCTRMHPTPAGYRARAKACKKLEGAGRIAMIATMRVWAIVLVVIVALMGVALWLSQRRTIEPKVSGFIEADEIRVGSRVGGRV